MTALSIQAIAGLCVLPLVVCLVLVLETIAGEKRKKETRDMYAKYNANNPKIAP